MIRFHLASTIVVVGCIIAYVSGVPLQDRQSSSSVATQLSQDFLTAEVHLHRKHARHSLEGKNKTHYEDPYTTSCQSGEVNITIVGIAGAICSPTCSVMDSCPKDKPPTVTAKAQCALQDMSGRKFCALICNPPDEKGNDDGECGENASCKAISGVGICTYDQ
ncbi:hypothetical protein GUITHDRAFT_155288 [Guillardia theta CCMP2712]|uniref:Uncharacterized protein n=1 Tax=Guillardia theta (strain CCMP2712) TaxID=905079 RepID=L1IK80_GUITC|nr:hypothetical protein GUITHDRAFT_155288 [Guillardia theta CCMP2712]EKX36210.1 hypothetical protein GUITHDRAFT_155288 [Guillardia theta CCMP2712]|eukprot:XP_005823190.1 hypothetical protein GUITHDRAFT_155288 [Guillardia theta CCMP2712]